MALATLSVDLVAKIAQFERDLGAAARASEKQSAAIVSRLRMMGSTVAGVFGGVTVGALVTVVRAQIDVIDGFNDIADATGATIENISALDGIAREYGHSIEMVGGTLVKFNAALKDAKPDSDSARIFKAIGLDVAELRKLDPAEALRRTAVALAGYADDGEKARAVQVLFGKSIREAAPFLKDLAEKGELTAKITSEQAAEAEKLNREIFKLQTNITDAGRAIAVELIPRLNQIIETYKDARKETVNFGDAQLTSLRKMIPFLAMVMDVTSARLGPAAGPQPWTGDMSDAQSRRMARKPPMKPPGADVKVKEDKEYLWFRSEWLKQYDEQLAAEKVLADKAEALAVYLIERLGKDPTDALSRRIASMERATQATASLNAELDRLSGAGDDDRKRQLTQALEDRLNAGEVFSPEQLDRMVRGIGGVTEELAKTRDVAGDFASVFESGFERAILKGEDLGDVLKSLGMDILQIGLRSGITQPLGAAAGSWVGSLFSSILPSFDIGSDYVPRDMIAKIHKGERIVRAADNRPGVGSGVTVVNNWTVGDVASMAQVQRAIAVSESRTAGSLARSRQYGGAFA